MEEHNDWQVAAEKLGGRVSSLERRVGSAEAYIDDVSRPFHLSVEKFMNTFMAIEGERDRVSRARHVENSERLEKGNAKLEQLNSTMARKSLIWTIAGVLVSIAALAVAVVAILVTIKLAHTGDLRQLPIFEHLSRVLASAQNSDAVIPPLRR